MGRPRMIGRFGGQPDTLQPGQQEDRLGQRVGLPCRFDVGQHRLQPAGAKHAGAARQSVQIADHGLVRRRHGQRGGDPGDSRRRLGPEFMQ